MYFPLSPLTLYLKVNRRPKSVALDWHCAMLRKSAINTVNKKIHEDGLPMGLGALGREYDFTGLNSLIGWLSISHIIKNRI